MVLSCKASNVNSFEHNTHNITNRDFDANPQMFPTKIAAPAAIDRSSSCDRNSAAINRRSQPSQLQLRSIKGMAGSRGGSQLPSSRGCLIGVGGHNYHPRVFFLEFGVLPL